MDDLYRDEILEHYRRPHNFGTLAHPDVSYEGANPLCGDRLTLMLDLDESGTVTDVAFTGRGCAISQASASLLTDTLRGRTTAELGRAGQGRRPGAAGHRDQPGTSQVRPAVAGYAAACAGGASERLPARPRALPRSGHDAHGRLYAAGLTGFPIHASTPTGARPCVVLRHDPWSASDHDTIPCPTCCVRRAPPCPRSVRLTPSCWCRAAPGSSTSASGPNGMRATSSGATHISRSYLEQQIDGAVPDHDAPVVLYCAGGTRSLFAAQTLQGMGYTDVSLDERRLPGLEVRAAVRGPRPSS